VYEQPIEALTNTELAEVLNSRNKQLVMALKGDPVSRTQLIALLRLNADAIREVAERVSNKEIVVTEDRRANDKEPAPSVKWPGMER